MSVVANLPKLSQAELVECLRDARAMFVEPDNSVIEYRKALIAELEHRENAVKLED